MKKWVTVPTQTGNIQTKYQTLIKHGCTFSIEKFNTSNNSDHDRHRYKISQHHSTDVTSRWVCKQASINSAKKWENEGKRATVYPQMQKFYRAESKSSSKFHKL